MRSHLFLLAGLCSGAATSLLAQTVVKIGHVAPVSGDFAHLGAASERGARMAIEDLNAKGLRIGGQPVKFELSSENDANDPKQAAAAAQKLCDSKAAGSVGHLSSSTVHGAARVYADCGIPFITPSSVAQPEPGTPTRLFYRMLPSPRSVAAAVAAGASVQTKRVAVLSGGTTWSDAEAGAFSEAAARLGATAGKLEHVSSAGDASGALLKTKPDIVFFSGNAAIAGAVATSAYGMPGRPRVLALGPSCGPEMAHIGSNALANVRCADAGTSVKQLDPSWVSRYRSKAGNSPGADHPAYAARSYDATMALALAMAQAGSVEPRKFSASLPQVDYKGVSTRIGFAKSGEPRYGRFRYIRAGRPDEEGTEDPGCPGCPTPSSSSGEGTPAIPECCKIDGPSNFPNR